MKTTIALLMYFTLVGACRGKAADDVRAGKVLTATVATTPGRSVSGYEEKPSGRSYGGRAPTPTVIFETTDLTSSIGNNPIVMRVQTFGVPIGDDLLNALAKESRLYTEDGSQEIPLRATVRGISGSGFTPGRYREIEYARVEIQPQTPLSDRWYVLKVQSLPNGLAMPRFAGRQTLPDGTIGARISPGSHPRPAALKVCSKEDGKTVFSIDWSEAVVRPSDLSSTATVREASAPPTAGDCVPDPGQRAGSVRSFRFLCQNVPAQGGRFLVALDRGIRGDRGGALDVPVPATGKLEVEVALDSMQAGREGCKVYRPW